jgi:hypothetical protein
MKRFLGAACILASLVAFSQPSWADPLPSQIQGEMAAGQWQQAHNDLMTVLRDHPDSHKAESMLATVDSHLAQRGSGGIVPLNMGQPQPQGHRGGVLLPIVLLVAGIWVVFRILRARRQRAMAGMYGAPGGQGFGRGPAPFNPNMGPPGYNQNPGYNPNMYPPQQPPAAGGGMMSGLAGGLLGGAIAGELFGGGREQPVNETIINENGNNAGNAGNDSWDNNSNSNDDWSQQADNWNNDDSNNDSWT